MKHSLRLSALCALMVFSVNSLTAQSITERVKGWFSDPRTSLQPVESRIPQTSPFSLSRLQTPQAISNAIQRLAQAFKLLSPVTLAQIVKTQKEKFEANSRAFAENPTWQNRAAIAGNMLAIAAATTALAAEAAVVGYGVKKGVEAGKRYKERKARQKYEQELSIDYPVRVHTDGEKTIYTRDGQVVAIVEEEKDEPITSEEPISSDAVLEGIE